MYNLHIQLNFDYEHHHGEHHHGEHHHGEHHHGEHHHMILMLNIMCEAYLDVR